MSYVHIHHHSPYRILNSGLKFPESPYTTCGADKSARVGRDMLERQILTDNIIVVARGEVPRDGDLDGALVEREVASQHT